MKKKQLQVTADKEKKIAYICSTYVQIMRVFQIQKELDEFKGTADLYLVHEMFNNPEFIERLKKIGRFANIYYIDTNEYKKAKILAYIYGKKYKGILQKYPYDRVVSFNIEEAIAQALYNINKKNSGFEFHCVEDGPGAYEVYKPQKYGWNHPYKWIGIEKHFFEIKTWWTGCPDFMKFPSGCQFQVKKLPPIKVNDYDLLQSLNYVFAYKQDNVLKNVDCLIMEESHYTDGLLPGNEDYEIYKKIVIKYPNLKFAIKLHPRTVHNRFNNLVSTLENSTVPWELILWNRVASNQPDLLQISIACGTMMSDKFMFGYEGPKMLLAKIFMERIIAINGYKRVNQETIERYEKFRNGYNNPKNFMLPKNEDEVFTMLDHLIDR